MPRFEPFRGLRYDATAVQLDDVIAPPYDVVGPDERHALESRSPYNAIRVELPHDEVGRDRYQAAAALLQAWQGEGVLVRDDEPGFYVYRMGFKDEQGHARQTAGVIGALEVARPGEGDVLPHERTMPKPKDDRLNLLRACQANISPIWGLSLSQGLSALCELPGPPLGRATDSEGVHHRLWRVTQPGVIEAIAEAVAAEPVVIADGHHRYETALAYRDERREQGAGSGDHDLVMALVVELSDEQLSVQPIHRLLGLPSAFDLPGALAQHFEVSPVDGASPTAHQLPARMSEHDALGLVTAAGTWLLRPRPATLATAEHDLDSSRFDVALAGLPVEDVRYQHGVDHVVGAVEKGEADAGVLLRPARVDQIAAAARQRIRMPEKTTFFHPKPRTGPVMRPLD